MKNRTAQPRAYTSLVLCVHLIALSAGALVPACGSDWAGAEEIESTQKPIVGGADTDISAIPWQAFLSIQCGASILNSDWVVSAAHCFVCSGHKSQATCEADPGCDWNANGSTCQPPAGSVLVYAGVSKWSDMGTGVGQAVHVSEWFIPNVQGSSPALRGDIALLHLSAPLNLSGPNALPIAPATLSDAPYFTPGTLALVSGWGEMENHVYPDKLQSVEVPIVPNVVASAALGYPLTIDELAAGYMATGGKNSCWGDSGGPLVVDSPRGPILAGVASWGQGDCTAPDNPGVYANIAAWAKWITQVTGGPTRMQWIADANHDGSTNLRKTYGTAFDRPLPKDYDGDGADDLTVLREDGGDWQWIVDTNRNGTVDLRKNYGLVTDWPVPADYDGDGKADFGVLRVNGSQWQWIIDTNRDGATDLRKDYGKNTDLPVLADYDGDGKTDFAVLRVSGSQWQWIIDTNRDGTTDLRKNYGLATDQPIPGDYDGDGKADFGVLRANGLYWQWLIDTNRDGVVDISVTWGLTSNPPVPADYDGDGKTDFAFVRVKGSQWQWFVDTNRDGGSDLQKTYGKKTDLPMPADFDGDGKADFAVIRSVQ